MRLLILSFYYPPDLSAGSFRVSALVQALVDARPDLNIDIVTTLPNRYSSFTKEAAEFETRDRVSIHRIRLPEHKSGILDQARSFVTYAREARRLTKNGSYDLIFSTSSRLMTALLGALLSRRLNAPLYSDVRDIFVDTISDVYPKLTFIIPAFSGLERIAISQSRSVNLVSKGFAPYFARRYPQKRVTFFTNGIDDEFLKTDPPAAKCSPGQPINVLYAGNLGEGQGLHVILPPLAKRLEGRVRFRILGDGGRKAALLAAISRSGVQNVDVLDPVGRDELIAEYSKADVLFVHLNDHAAFRKVLPSKLFEYAATGKPIWAGLSGYSAEFAQAEIENVALFSPCDARDAETSFSQLRLGTTDRSVFIQQFSRRDIARAMARDVLVFLPDGDVH